MIPFNYMPFTQRHKWTWRVEHFLLFQWIFFCLSCWLVSHSPERKVGLCVLTIIKLTTQPSAWCCPDRTTKIDLHRRRVILREGPWPQCPKDGFFFFLFKAKTSIPFSTSMIASLSLFTSWACCEQGLVHWVFLPLSRPSSCLTPRWWWKQPWASSARYLHWGFYLSKMNLEQYTLPWVKLIPDILCN